MFCLQSGAEEERCLSGRYLNSERLCSSVLPMCLFSLFCLRSQRRADMHQECQIDRERLHVTVEITKHRLNLPPFALCSRALSGYLLVTVEADVALFFLALIYRFTLMIFFFVVFFFLVCFFKTASCKMRNLGNQLVTLGRRRSNSSLERRERRANSRHSAASPGCVSELCAAYSPRSQRLIVGITRLNLPSDTLHI